MTETPEQSPGRTAPQRKDHLGLNALYEVPHITEDTARKLLGALERSHPVQRLRGNQVATAVVSTTGLALLLVGIENAAADIPITSNAWGSIIVGLILPAATGLLIRRLMQ